VVEIEQALVDWMRDGTVPHGPALLADQRVSVIVADIAVAVAEARPESYDLLLLDVDNGPDHLVHQANAALYRGPFLTAVHDLLRPGGAVAVWSAARSAELAEALGGVFDPVEELEQPVQLQDREETYWLYVGRRTR
jgi:spermidine synthase